MDKELEGLVEIHCLGGFALLLLLDKSRPTGDVDYIGVLPHEAAESLDRLAGRESALAAAYKLYLQQVGVADAPCDYAERLLDATPSEFARLRVKVLDPHDLVLTKVQRGSPRDRQDAGALISELGLDKKTLRSRFEEELKPYLAVAPDKTSLTFDLWLEEFFSS